MAASSPARSPSISCCSSRGSSGPSCPGPCTRDAPSSTYVGFGVRSLPMCRWSHAVPLSAIGTTLPFVAAADGRRLRDRTATTDRTERSPGGMLLTEGETPDVTRIASATARLALGATLIAVTVLGQVAAHAQASGPSIVSLTLNGVVAPFTADYITSNVARAQADGDEA